VCLTTYGIDTTVWSTAIGHFQQAFLDIFFFEIDRLGFAMIGCHMQPFGDASRK
jgi:hypothetical protein